MAQKTTTDVARQSFSDDKLGAITSFADAAALLNDSGVAVEDYSDYGTGFTVLKTEHKDQLTGAPFVILEWRFTDGDNGEFVSALIVTKDNRKLVLNDGSTGIKDQLKAVTASRESSKHKNPTQGLVVPNGLTRSDYQYADPKTGELRPATTFYLSN